MKKACKKSQIPKVQKGLRPKAQGGFEGGEREAKRSAKQRKREGEGVKKVKHVNRFSGVLLCCVCFEAKIKQRKLEVLPEGRGS